MTIDVYECHECETTQDAESHDLTKGRADGTECGTAGCGGSLEYRYSYEERS